MKRQRYYIKDKKALIYQTIRICDNGSMPKSYYVPRSSSPLWCYARQLSQDTIFEAATHGEDESRFFVFNRGTIVEIYDLILYRSKWYQVTRTDTEDDYNTDIYVYVKDAPMGVVPKEESLKEYGWTPADND